MATTAAYPSTSPASLYQNQWDHSVPLNDESSSGYRGRDDTYARPTNQLSRQIPPTQANSTFRTLHSKTSATNMNGYGGERRGSEPNKSEGRRPSVQDDGTGVVGRKRSIGSGMNEENVDDSAWIHRDKLAQIESRELAAAGIRVKRPTRDGGGSASRSQSRASNKRAHSRDRYANGSPQVAEAPAFPSFEEQRPQRRSPVAAAGDWSVDTGGAINHELRTQEEVAAERESQQQYARNVIRPSTSRIPVAKTSPLPVPPKVVERDSPLPRSRHGSNNFSSHPEDGIAYRKSRGRSQSLGSQAQFGDYGTPTQPRSRPASSQMQGSPMSPTKARIPDKAGPTGRKGANARAFSGAKQRPTSSVHKDSPKRRPASSHISRPSGSINRPEGEAPWIATMYKPDPRLPQDQQMLPTHAKRMLQEQWEKEGKTGDAYDRDFNLLNDRDPSRPNSLTPSPSPIPPQTNQSAEPIPQNEQPPWPLRSPKPGSVKEGSPARPSTSGGYKITPTISSPHVPQRPIVIGNHSQVTATARGPVKRMPDVDEKGDGKKKKSFACCIVM